MIKLVSLETNLNNFQEKLILNAVFCTISGVLDILFPGIHYQVHNLFFYVLEMKVANKGKGL